MQKIQKFQLGRLYAAPKSNRTFELLARDGHILIFQVRNLKTRDAWKKEVRSTFKADASGAFEEVFFSDGIRLNSLAA